LLTVRFELQGAILRNSRGIVTIVEQALVLRAKIPARTRQT
jgi:hypothetical protein